MNESGRSANQSFLQSFGNPPVESIIKCNTQPVQCRVGQALRTTHP